MTVYDVLVNPVVNTEDIIERCIRNRGVDCCSAREALRQLSAAIRMFDEQLHPSPYTMVGVICPDKACRIFAVDTRHIDVKYYTKTVGTMPDIPDLQEMSVHSLLGMEVSPANILEIGHSAFAEAFLRAMMPGVDIATYWAPRRACKHFNDDLKTCIKQELAKYNDAKDLNQ